MKNLFKTFCAALWVLGSGHVAFSQNGYVAGDFHQHTTYTDGSYSFGHMMAKNNQFGLDWWANSEHGGESAKNGRVSGADLGITTYWDSYLPNIILGKSVTTSGHQSMWRWQVLRDSSFAQVLATRAQYPSKTILQCYELNVSGHELASLGLIANQFSATPNCNPLAQFEFMFDNSDVDDAGGLAQGWTKSTLAGHAKALEAIGWLQTNYPASSYLVPAHPERQKKYTIADFRDMNNAGPDVCFGFESMPGHQKSAGRGGYTANSDGGVTYGGCGFYAANVGGLWDAMLSEGRGFWLFANSDCHDEAGDFYPGEYQKNYTYTTGKSAQAIVDGLRSGNTWVVEGDLIDSLVYTIETVEPMKQSVGMGSRMVIGKGKTVKVSIKARDSQGVNNNKYSDYTNPILDHIDLIRGKMCSKIQPSNPLYTVANTATTEVIARFDAIGGVADSKSITSTKWTSLGNGWVEMSLTLSNVTDSVYFRLRGTNQGLNLANETDGAGNPLSDSNMGTNDAIKAFADLWFYSNPIFVYTNLSLGSVGNEADYTVPSWTNYLRARKALATAFTDVNVATLESAIANLKSANDPYSIVMSLHGNPTTNMAFNWFTNVGVKDGKVEIVPGVATSASAFDAPAFSILAQCDSVKNLNYCNSSNNLLALADLANNTKKSYMRNKALATTLSANTTYSFRVGKAGAWSEIGTFTTAKNSKEEFSFIYFTDPQANADAMFDISQKTTHAALMMYPNANFMLSCGDLVESSGSNNSEWEYEQFLSTQQDIWMNKPLVSVTGNHDKSTNKNFTNHFYTDSVAFDYKMSTTPGAVYSFVYGDALFMALSYEDYSVPGYLDALANWMTQQVNDNPTVKWRIAYYHKTMYTGSVSHQSDADGKAVREKMGPVFDNLKISWAIQGHDHVYEVMGPIKNNQIVANAVTNQTSVSPVARENLTGKEGGTFDVADGTLYFLNNSGGKKKYEPRTEAQMTAAVGATGIPNYFSYFTGRFGQTGEPTFSYVSVATSGITVSTYTVSDLGVATLFDSYSIVKNELPTPLKTEVEENLLFTAYPNPAHNSLEVRTSQGELTHLTLFTVSGMQLKTFTSYGDATLDISDIAKGVYLLKASTNGNNSILKIVKE